MKKTKTHALPAITITNAEVHLAERIEVTMARAVARRDPAAIGWTGLAANALAARCGLHLQPLGLATAPAHADRSSAGNTPADATCPAM